MVCSFVEARVRTSVDKPAKGRALLELAELYLFRFKKREEAARCIERSIQLTANHPLARLYSTILTLLEAPKEALSWLNARQINSVVQLEPARATIAVLLGVLDGEKFEISQRLADQFASLRDQPIILRAAMCHHSFAGAVEAFHDAAKLTVSELVQAESRAAYLYSLAMSAINEGLAVEHIVAYAEDLMETGVQTEAYCALLAEARILAGDHQGAGLHFEAAARLCRETTWANYYRRQSLLAAVFTFKQESNTHRAKFDNLGMADSVIEHWLHGVMHVGQQSWEAFDALLSQCRRKRPIDCPMWAVDTWHLVGLRLHTRDHWVDRDQAFVESLLDELSEQYGQSSLLELQRVALASLSDRPLEAKRKFEAVRSELLSLEVESVEACVELSRLLSPVNQELFVDDGVYRSLAGDILGRIVLPNEYLIGGDLPRQLMQTLLRRSRRGSDPHVLRGLLNWSAWLADYIGESHFALERARELLRLGEPPIGALVIGMRAARKLRQPSVAYKFVCRLASLTEEPIKSQSTSLTRVSWPSRPRVRNL